jgi:hypothetical protein
MTRMMMGKSGEVWGLQESYTTPETVHETDPWRVSGSMYGAATVVPFPLRCLAVDCAIAIMKRRLLPWSNSVCLWR